MERNDMKNNYKSLAIILIAIDFILFIAIITSGHPFLLLHPKGMIALQERNFMLTALSLMLLVVIPVFIFTFLIAWKYRATNTKAKYSPEWTGNTFMKLTWWAIPTTVIIILAVITWKGTHQLDPYKPIQSTTKPITIKVVALNWKWLFIYPEQNIATVNFVQFPAKTPINFELTADAPMNSFWIPQLGGQMYAMAGMQTQLHLIADEPGDFAGTEVEINGPGFAGMKFTARASSQASFDAWVQSVKQSSPILDTASYNSLSKPTEYNPPAYYAPVEKNLYNGIMMKFMAPATGMQNMNYE